MTESETREYIRARINAMYGPRNIPECAREIGVTAAHLNRVLRGERPIGPKISKAFKLKECVTYEKL